MPASPASTRCRRLRRRPQNPCRPVTNAPRTSARRRDSARAGPNCRPAGCDRRRVAGPRSARSSCRVAICCQVAPRSVLRKMLPRMPKARIAPSFATTAPKYEPTYGDVSAVQVAPPSSERASVPDSATRNDRAEPADDDLRDVTIEVLAEDHAALPGLAGVGRIEVQAEGAVGDEVIAAEVRHAEQRIRAGLLERNVPSRCSPPSSVRTSEPPWPTATPTFGIRERNAGQRARDRCLARFPGLRRVVRGEREAAFADGHEPVGRARTIHQDDAVGAHIDDGLAPGRGRRRVVLRRVPGASGQQARAEPDARGPRPVLHGRSPARPAAASPRRPAPDVQRRSRSSTLLPTAVTQLPDHFVPMRRSASGWKSAHLPFSPNFHGFFTSLSSPAR